MIAIARIQYESIPLQTQAHLVAAPSPNQLQVPPTIVPVLPTVAAAPLTLQPIEEVPVAAKTPPLPEPPEIMVVPKVEVSPPAVHMSAAVPAQAVHVYNSPALGNDAPAAAVNTPTILVTGEIMPLRSRCHFIFIFG